VSSTTNEFLILGGCVLLLAGPGAWLLTRAALRPVERMRREVGELSARNVGAGLRVPGTRDEIAALARTFNSLLERLNAALAREQALVADAGHELRTPLTVLKGELELASRPNRTREELATTVTVAAEETERLMRLTEDLLFLSREEVDGQRGFPVEEFDVVALAAQTVSTMAPRAFERRVYLAVQADGPVLACGNRDWIGRAIANLVANALRFGPAGTTVEVAVAEHDDEVTVTVADDGPGFPPEFLPVAFDRFTRADDSRRRPELDAADTSGSGLGLAIVASIAARHGGSAAARNRPEGGAEVEISWPKATAGRRTSTEVA
jgi:signal transduction histidine kinase